MAARAEKPAGSPYHPEIEKKLEDQSPSTKLVALVLQRRSELLIDDIETHTLLPRSTVRYALDNLQAAGLVEAEINYRDPRMKRYIWLSSGFTDQ